MSASNMPDCYQECDIFNVKPLRIRMLIELPKLESRNKVFTIKNKTTQLQVVTIDPPLSNYFQGPSLKSEKRQIPPAKSLEVPIKLCGIVEARPYYDRMKVTCSKGCEVYVRLIACPTIKDVLKIPHELNLGSVPLGETLCHSITIPAMKDKVPFLIIPTIYNPDVTIDPLRGSVSKESAIIKICYTPKAYVTLWYPVHLYLPTVSTLPLLITITADSKPGVLSEMIFKKEEKAKSKFCLTLPFVKIQSSKESPKHTELGWSHHKTNLLLMEKEEEKRPPEYELKGPFGQYLKYEETVKKSKQSQFIKEVLRFRKSCLLPLNHRRPVVKQLTIRENSKWDGIWNDYQEENDKKNRADEYETKPLFLRQRIIVPVSTEPELIFTHRLPNLWFVQRQILYRFIEAARRIILWNRLLKRLETLKKYIEVNMSETKRCSAQNYDTVAYIPST